MAGIEVESFAQPDEFQELPRVSVEFAGVRGFDKPADAGERVEVKTTGDGFLAMFDGGSRAVRCAAAISVVAEVDDLRVRAGIHSGEVERQAGDLRGVAVHVATRVAGLAQAGEVLVSESAGALLDGSDLPLEDAGEHELKGVPGRRRLNRLIQ